MRSSQIGERKDAMSSGSYFTIYRKNTKFTASNGILDALKNEYFLSNKKDTFNSKKSDEELKADLPVLMDSEFKSDHSCESKPSYVYYDGNGIKYDKLLEFHFGSAFSCLREEFGLNPYSFSRSAVLVDRSEAEKMLQAVEYVLSEEYGKNIEKILNNKYVNMFGHGYSPFDKRFSTHREPIYIDREGKSYVVKFSDSYYGTEIAEEDASIRYCLEHLKACLLAFLNAEVCTWDGEELVLEYSVYG